MNKTEQTYYPDDLITAYLNNELNKEQRVELEQWVAADTAHKQYFYEMTEVWLAANAASGTQEESNRAFQHFRGRISVSQKKTLFIAFCQSGGGNICRYPVVGRRLLLGA